MQKTENQIIDYQAKVEARLRAVAQEKSTEVSHRNYVAYDRYLLTQLKRELCSLLTSVGAECSNPFSIKLELPPSHVDFDIAFPVFPYCKTSKKSPSTLASEIVKVISSQNSNLIHTSSAVNGYVNISIKKDFFYKSLIGEVFHLKDKYGESNLHKGETVFIDYSSPNIAKPFGVGHLRSTVIGESLGRIYNAVGFTVIRDNHLGDWGTQFGSLICAYRKWGDDEKIEANPIEELKNLYVRFTSEADDNPILKEEARKTFARLEEGDPELVNLWLKFRDLSLSEFDKTYKDLNIIFDIVVGESLYVQGSDSLVQALKEKGIAHDTDDGAVVVENLKNLPSFLIKKSDGSTLYVLRDMFAAIHRKQVFNPSIILYVVGSEQELNFRQLFALLQSSEVMGNTQMRHIGFGLVLVDGKKMSTRKGTLVNLDEVLNQLTAKSKEIMVNKNTGRVGDIDVAAKKIAISAMVYSDLRQNRSSNVDFDWKRMLNLDSGSVVYLQYTYARVLSILGRLNGISKSFEDFIFEDQTEFSIARLLSFYPEVLIRATEHDAPHLICEFLEELTAEVNSFYDKISVQDTTNEALRQSRLALLQAVSICIENALKILNVPMLEKL
jgi:arginyl-tRNA synthetase